MENKPISLPDTISTKSWLCLKVHDMYMRCMCNMDGRGRHQHKLPATSYQLPATSYQLYSNVLQPLLQLLLRLCVEGLPQLFQIKFHGSQMLMQLQIDIVQLLYIYRYVGAVHNYASWLAAIPWVSCSSCFNWLVATP